MTMGADGLDERVTALKAARPGAFRLACILSLASRVEPALLRQARLQLTDVDASAEADLWSSPVVASHTSRGFVFDTRAGESLRAELAADPELFEKAWTLIAWEHRSAPWSIRAEEAINRYSASSSPGDAERAEQVLLAAARHMAEAPDRTTAGQWVMRALARLPARLGRSPAARAIHAGAGVYLGGRLDLSSPGLPPDAMESWLPWLVSGARRIEVGVGFGDGFVEIDTVAAEADTTLAVPDTSPVVLDVSWHDGFSGRTERVTFERGSRGRVAVTSTEIELRAIDGARYLVRRAGAAPRLAAGFDFDGLRARHRPFLGRSEELAELESLGPQVIGIIGAAGTGKTALLCALLDRLEARGERVVAHFVEGGPAAWSDPDAIEASLLAQLAFLDPEVAPPTGHPPFVESLQAHASADRALYVLIDGLDGGGLDRRLLARMGTFTLPANTAFVYASTARSSLAAMLAPRHAVVDLNGRRESSRRVCELYLDHRQPDVDRCVVPGQQKKVFISYSQQDRALAREVQDILGPAGLDAGVFFADGAISIGESWEKQLRESIEAADLNIVLVTPASADSAFVAREVETMRTSGKPIWTIASDASALSALERLGLQDIQAIVDTPSARWQDRLREAAVRLAAADGPRRWLLDRADGVVGRLVRMMAWVAAWPPGPVDLTGLPPTLYDGFAAAWERLGSQHPEADAARQIAGLLAAAKTNFSAGMLRTLLGELGPAYDGGIQRLTREGLIAGTRGLAEGRRTAPNQETTLDPLERKLRQIASLRDKSLLDSSVVLDIQRKLLHDALSVEPAQVPRPDLRQGVREENIREEQFLLTDDSLRRLVLDALGSEVERDLHDRLAEVDDDHYRLYSRLGHLVDAGHLEEATAAALDVPFLMQICERFGVGALEAQLEYVEAATDHPSDRGPAA